VDINLFLKKVDEKIGKIQKSLHICIHETNKQSVVVAYKLFRGAVSHYLLIKHIKAPSNSGFFYLDTGNSNSGEAWLRRNPFIACATMKQMKKSL
jgi:hypothetical protein